MLDIESVLLSFKISEILNDIRNGYASLTSLTAIELDPRVGYRVIAHSKTVHGSPKTPSRPFADMWMDLSGYDQSYEVTDMCADDSSASAVCSVTQVCEAEYYWKGKGSTNSSKSIGGDTIESQRPDILLAF